MTDESQVDKLSSEENAYLVINSQIFPLQRITTNIGRKLENDLVIQDALVSRLHAQIRYEEGQFVLYDMESTGGTFVNNKKVELHLIQEIMIAIAQRGGIVPLTQNACNLICLDTRGY